MRSAWGLAAWVAAIGGSVAACSFLTSSDGLAGPSSDASLEEQSETGSPDDAAAADATLDAPPNDAGDLVDADPDAADAYSPYVAAVLADKPVAYWRLGETGGTVAHDMLGLHDGTYIGPVSFGTPGALLNDGDRAATFSAASRVVAGNNFALAGGVPFSIELWMMPEVVDTAFRMPIAKRKFGPPGEGGYFIYLQATNGLCGQYLADAGYRGVCVDAGNAPINAFTHVVFTYDSVQCRLYRNGVLTDENNCNDMLVPVTTAQLTIGAADESGLGAFEGTIDEVALYDHLLTAPQVQAHYVASGH